jgi:hypothetical protein
MGDESGSRPSERTSSPPPSVYKCRLRTDAMLAAAFAICGGSPFTAWRTREDRVCGGPVEQRVDEFPRLIPWADPS